MKTEFSLRFLSVDLSRREAVLLRGGPLWKGLGGIITYTYATFCTTFPLALWSNHHLSVSLQNEGLLSVGCAVACGSTAHESSSTAEAYGNIG